MRIVPILTWDKKRKLRLGFARWRSSQIQVGAATLSKLLATALKNWSRSRVAWDLKVGAILKSG